MDDLQSWWSIAKDIGAGATFVLGPLVYFLWNAWGKDRDYIREADKNTLKILSELTGLMQMDGKDGERRHGEVLKAIQHCAETMKAHYDANKK